VGIKATILDIHEETCASLLSRKQNTARELSIVKASCYRPRVECPVLSQRPIYGCRSAVYTK